MRSALAVLLLALVGCGGAEPSTVLTPSGTAQAASATAGQPQPLPAGSLRRSALHAVIAQGLGVFLRHVSVDEHPVFVAGHFHGFRITALHDADWWRGVDLKPGDVVTKVNGLPIEHPEEALEAFKSLEVSSELRVDYERDGVPRELRYAIVDDVPVQAAPPPG